MINHADTEQVTRLYSTANAQKILTLKLANMARTLQSIGDEVGVSREYVRQVLKYNYIPTNWDSRRGYPLATTCKYCNITLTLKYDKKKGCCATCRTDVRWKSIRKEVICPNCKKPFWMRKKDRRIQYSYPRDPFCSYSCSSKFHEIGYKYGFGAKHNKHLTV